MTETDYQKVYTETPVVVGKRIGFNSDASSPEDLLDFIKSHDPLAFSLMENFRNAYSEWWQLSRAIDEINNPDALPSLRENIRKKISQRNEIRKALICYLNFKYGDVNGSH